MTPETTEEAARAMQHLLDAATADTDDPLTIAGHALTPRQVIDVLAPYLTEGRRARIDEVLAQRTYTVATVVEGLINTGNVSAVMRSAEALGFQAFHVVTNEETLEDTHYKTSPRTSQGAEKWLDVRLWPTPAACAEHLKAKGYQIVVTHLDADAVPIDAIDFTRKTALVFGNELHGVSPAMLAVADRTCIVPMQGFTQSFNISVAAAVCLYHAHRDRLARQGQHGDLTHLQHTTLQALFYLKSVRHAPQLLQHACAAPSDDS